MIDHITYIRKYYTFLLFKSQFSSKTLFAKLKVLFLSFSNTRASDIMGIHHLEPFSFFGFSLLFNPHSPLCFFSNSALLHLPPPDKIAAPQRSQLRFPGFLPSSLMLLTLPSLYLSPRPLVMLKSTLPIHVFTWMPPRHLSHLRLK